MTNLAPLMSAPSCVLLPLEEAVNQMEAARDAARIRNADLYILACTDARSAVALLSDIDRRDLKFLSGSRTRDGLHAYCGGIQAAIDRAMIYARCADAVCYRTAVIDLLEAEKFAEQIRTFYPGMRLGFGNAPRPDGAGWNEVQHQDLETKLRDLGYDYYFVTQFGYSFFFSHLSRAAVLIHDAAPTEVIPFCGDKIGEYMGHLAHDHIA